MNRILLINFEFIIAFSTYFLLSEFMIKCIIKASPFTVKYFILKMIPGLCLLTIAISLYGESSIFTVPNINTAEKVTSIYNGIFTENTVNYILVFSKYFFFAWVIGIIVFLIKYSIEYLCFKHVYKNEALIASDLLNEKLALCKTKSGVARNAAIYYSTKTGTPFTFGIIRPRIILPADLSENMELIILHELIHCGSYDMMLKTVNEVLKIIQWFNPFMYLYTMDMENLCEIACDEKVSVLLTFDEKKKYAYEIIKNARKHQYPVFSVTFSSVKNYKRRLHHILYPNGSRKKIKVLVAVYTALIVFGGIYFLHSIHHGPASVIFSNVFRTGESQLKTIRMNYFPGQEGTDYYYEEYIDGFWWRGTLLAEKSRILSNKLIEVSFSGELYKCDE